MSDVLAIIPARFDSKGITAKNFRHLAGTTPVQRAVDCCAAAHVRSIVTTDYAAHATNWMWIERPAHLAQDETPMIDVVRHALSTIHGPEDEIILLVQPTQPLREPKHLKEAIRLMEQGAASVVSVTDTESPERMMVYGPSTFDLVSYLDAYDDLPIERRQDGQEVLRRDGTVYAFRRGFAQKCIPWYLHPCVPLMVPKSETCELDTPDDWAIAEIRLAAKEALLRA
jgi:CMP-N-acetylneuraminic acid synthetase